MASRLLKGVGLVLVFVLALFKVRVELRRALDAYFRGDTVTTPDLRGHHHDRARQLVGDALVLEVARQTYDPEVPPGVVISQDPPAGIRVRRGKTIFLRVSKGADLQPVPSVKGGDLRKASIALRNVGLQVGAVCFVRDRSVKNGTVLDQTPEVNENLGRGGRVDLLLAANTRERGGTLPRVEDLPREVAVQVLKAAGVPRIHLLETHEDQVPAGTVLAQQPPGGTLFDQDTVARLEVALPTDAGAPHKLLEIGFSLPPGLNARELVVVVHDDLGRRVVHRSRHLPGERVSMETEGRGAVRVEYYLDDLMVDEESY